MRKKRRRTPDVGVPTASMGDIAFLLTIFFMVCSNFAKESGVVLKPPQSRDVAAIKEGIVFVAIDEAGKIYLNGVELQDPEAVEWGVRGLLGNRTEPEQRLVNFKCDRNITRQVFEPVLDAIAAGGGMIAAAGEQMKDDKP